MGLAAFLPSAHPRIPHEEGPAHAPWCCPPCVTVRSVRTRPSERGSPLGGRVCVQHAAPLHPTPDGVHASQRLLLQAAAASVDALLDPKH